MQYIYENNTNETSLSQSNNEAYAHSSHIHQHALHGHFQYQHEVQSFSPQQSSTSDIEEASPPPPPSSSVNKTSSAVNNKLPKKKKQTKKKRKDPNEPQKPVSPYALFFRDTQNDIKKKLSNPSFGEISKVVAHMWESIEPEIKERYKSKAAAAKKEYLKQLAAYRAVQISNQTPNMHHFLSQNSLSFDAHAIQHQQKQYHAGPMTHNHHHGLQPFCPPSATVPPQKQTYNNYHYMCHYSQDTSNSYHSDRQSYFSNPNHQTYSSYDSNNNYSEYQQYGLLRPVMESEHYSSYYSQSSVDNEHTKINENLLHNLNNNNASNNTHTHYTELTSMNNASIGKHFDNANSIHHSLNNKKPDEHSTLLSTNSNENNFHWNQTTCLNTQW